MHSPGTAAAVVVVVTGAVVVVSSRTSVVVVIDSKVVVPSLRVTEVEMSSETEVVSVVVAEDPTVGVVSTAVVVVS